MKLTTLLKTMTLCATLTATTALAGVDLGATKEAYKTLVNDALVIIVNNDPAQMPKAVQQLERALQLGVDMANTVKETHPEGKALLDMSTGSIDIMKAQTVEDIETNWHHGAAFKAKGIDNDSFDHYGPVIAANDGIVHPATAIVAINTYLNSSDKDEDLLDRAKTELEEIVEQINYVDKK